MGRRYRKHRDITGTPATRSGTNRRMQALRLFFSSFYFMATIAIAVAALIVTGIQFPDTLIVLKREADLLLNMVSDSYFEPRYALLREFVFDGKNVILIGYVIATRVVLALLRALLFPSDDYWDRRRDERGHDGKSPFNRWGKRGS